MRSTHVACTVSMLTCNPVPSPALTAGQVRERGTVVDLAGQHHTLLTVLAQLDVLAQHRLGVIWA